LTDRKFSGRVDANLGIGTIFGYYYFDQFSLNNPYPVATVPGFAATTTGRTQVINIGDTKFLGNSSVNEARIGYLRVNDLLNKPNSGTSKSALRACSHYRNASTIRAKVTIPKYMTSSFS
jgi:hypothetical protein